MRNRGVDIDGFARYAAAFFHRHGTQRAHIVQTVCELDEDHSHVARHRQQHLAEILRLRFLAATELHFVELGQTIDQFRDLGAKALGQFGFGHALVFHYIMQQSRHDGLGVKLPVGADFRDGNRMGDVGFAALAILPEMGFVAEMERRLDLFQFRLGQVA